MANQTTMLRGETEEVQRRIRAAMEQRYGAADLARHFRFFDTICGATQDRQDALEKLLAEPLDLLLVIGGYNSSNTSHLAEMGESRLPTYFIKNASKMVSENLIHHYNQHAASRDPDTRLAAVGSADRGDHRRGLVPQQPHRGYHPAPVRPARHRDAGVGEQPEPGGGGCLVFARELEQRERITLAAYAQFSGETRGRLYDEPLPEWRTHYQRDRDRIIHSRAFRRLEYKTQVFLNGTGDHLRTRLTHTMEVAAIARNISRALRLNEDLAEAIALAHDLGHSPFGHSGEQVLNRLMRRHGGFEHNQQSLRIVELLEQKYPGFAGLNLTWEVREGLAKHVTTHDRPRGLPGFEARSPSLEAQVANLADEIAYYSHDLDDGLEAGLLSEARCAAMSASGAGRPPAFAARMANWPTSAGATSSSAASLTIRCTMWSRPPNGD